MIGWHFLYEGYFKLVTPGVGTGRTAAQCLVVGRVSERQPPVRWPASSTAIGTSSWIGAVDVLIPFALAAVGLGLMLGLFTQLACAGGMALLTLFYLSADSDERRCRSRALEGAYLLVNKTLIELAALAVVHAFRTGRIAGIDRVVCSTASSGRCSERRQHDHHSGKSG